MLFTQKNFSLFLNSGILLRLQVFEVFGHLALYRSQLSG